MLITLTPFGNSLSIYQLSPGQTIPPELLSEEFCSVTRTIDEVSIVSEVHVENDEIRASHGWRGLMVEGVLDFSLTGIISRITEPLGRAGISVFTISTYNTDYLLVRDEKFAQAVEILNNTHNIRVTGY